MLLSSWFQKEPLVTVLFFVFVRTFGYSLKLKEPQTKNHCSWVKVRQILPTPRDPPWNASYKSKPWYQLLKSLCNLTRKQKVNASTFDSTLWKNTFWTPRGRSLVSVLHTTPAQSPLHKSHRPWQTFLSITNADYMKAEKSIIHIYPTKLEILL